MVDGADFWISCKLPAFLSSFSCLQVIQNSAPSTISWRQCDIPITIIEIALQATCIKWLWLLLLCLKTQVRGHFCTALLCQMMPDRIIKCLIILFTRYYYQAVMLLFYLGATPSIVFSWFDSNVMNRLFVCDMHNAKMYLFACNSFDNWIEKNELKWIY